MKRLAVQIHLWLGLTLGLLWAVQGLTGSLLVFHRELERVGVETTAGPMLPLDRLIAIGTAAAGAPVERLNRADTGGDIVTAGYTAADGEARSVQIDAASGRVLGVEPVKPVLPEAGAFWRWVYYIHHNFLGGETGEIIVGASGLVLLGSTILGVWIAWPKRRGWAAAFRMSAWRSRPQQLYGWHRATGLMAGVAMLLLAVTGSYMVFSQPVRDAVGSFATVMQPPKPASVEILPPPRVTAQAVFETATARFPGATFSSLRLPSAKSPVYAVRVLQAGEVRAFAGTTQLIVDPQTGEVLWSYDALAAPMANLLFDAAFSLHNGEILGIAGRIGIFLAGFALPLFYVTGIWLWLAKRRRRVAPALAPAA